MRTVYSYVRLVLASWLFLAGVALQFGPSAASVGRDARWRERQLQAVPAEQRSKWVQDQDAEDARSEGAMRLFGVLMGGLGFAGALLEAAYLCALYSRRGSRDAA